MVAMTTRQAAERLGITVHGVRDHIARGNLRAELVPDMRGGRVWRIRREDVEELARRREGK
jgi:excisionase family DNA binding protein